MLALQLVLAVVVANEIQHVSRSQRLLENYTISVDIAPPTLIVLNPGGSASQPALGEYVRILVTFNGDAAPWVRIDRPDGVADTTPFMRIADEAASFVGAPSFPFWMKPAWGPTVLYFGGSVDNRPIALVASAWSSRYNGTRVTGNSTPATIYFNPKQNGNFTLQVDNISPGTARLTIISNNNNNNNNTTTTTSWDQVRFDRFVLTSTTTTKTITPPTNRIHNDAHNDDITITHTHNHTQTFELSRSRPRSTSTSAPPEFITSFVYHEESASGSVVVAFQQPGIYYYGATPSFEGREFSCTAGGVYDGKPSTHPVALVVTGPTGLNESLPEGFAGTVHHMSPLVTPHQFCIVHTNITVFSGSRLNVDLCRPNPTQEIPPQPAFVSIVAPSWLRVLPQNNQTCSQHCNANYFATITATVALTNGLVRTTMRSNSARDGVGRWSIYNNHVPVYFIVDKALAPTPAYAPIHNPTHHPIAQGMDGSNVNNNTNNNNNNTNNNVNNNNNSNNNNNGNTNSNNTTTTTTTNNNMTSTPVSVSINVLIHTNASDASDTPLQLWQTLTANVVPTPVVRLPKRLAISITWSTSSLLLDGPAGVEYGLDYLTMYKRLGFNTVPLVSSQSALDHPWMYKGNRTGAAWQGLIFGPEISGVVPTSFGSIVSHPPNVSKLPVTTPPLNITLELEKWRLAYMFHNATGEIDVGYDGVFFQTSVDKFCAIIKQSEPEWVFLDDESYATLQAWEEVVNKSGNAESRRLPGETDSALAWRMIEETLGVWTRCLPPTTTVGWYSSPFPDQVFSNNAMSMQPSEYGPQHYLKTYPTRIKEARLRQTQMSGGRQRHLLPWITACTYGQMDAQLTFASTLHTFAGGATGFAFFEQDCFNDPGKMLALAAAIDLVSPYENVILDGNPVISVVSSDETDETDVNVLAWGGMQLNETYFLAVTSAESALPWQVVLRAPEKMPLGGFVGCDLINGAEVNVKQTGEFLTVMLTPTQNSGATTAILISSKEKMKNDDNGVCPTSTVSHLFQVLS